MKNINKKVELGARIESYSRSLTDKQLSEPLLALQQVQKI